MLGIILAALAAVKPGAAFFLRGVFYGGLGGNGADDAVSLRAEVDSLKAQLAVYAKLSSELTQASPELLPVAVYSRYPFALKNELLVNAGSAEGVAAGQVAVYRGVFLGRVEQVYPHSSLVETVFDSRLKLPVRIGSQGADALLQGGASPLLTLVSGKSLVNKGDAVVSAGVIAPYGLAVGTAGDVSSASGGLFEEAALDLPYSVTDIQAVEIIKNYVPPFSS